MKTCRILALFTMAVFALPGAFPVHAHPAPPFCAFTTSKGAANLTELGKALFQALQANNFDLLAGYLPSDTELNALRKTGSEDMKALLESNTAADIESQFKNDFHTIIQQGISQTLNWSDLSMAETRAGKPAASSRMLLPVALRLQNKVNQILTIQFEALRLNNRYYLFRRVQMQ